MASWATVAASGKAGRRTTPAPREVGGVVTSAPRTRRKLRKLCEAFRGRIDEDVIVCVFEQFEGSVKKARRTLQGMVTETAATEATVAAAGAAEATQAAEAVLLARVSEHGNQQSLSTEDDGGSIGGGGTGVTCVKVRGLGSDVELNGLIGVRDAWSEEKQRFRVIFDPDSGHGARWLKPTNFDVIKETQKKPASPLKFLQQMFLGTVEADTIALVFQETGENTNATVDRIYAIIASSGPLEKQVQRPADATLATATDAPMKASSVPRISPCAFLVDMFEGAGVSVSELEKAFLECGKDLHLTVAYITASQSLTTESALHNQNTPSVSSSSTSSLPLASRTSSQNNHEQRMHPPPSNVLSNDLMSHLDSIFQGAFQCFVFLGDQGQVVLQALVCNGVLQARSIAH